MREKGCNCVGECKCERRTLQCDCDMIHSDKVAIVKTKMLNEKVLSLVAEFYKTLSDSTRLKILNLLEESELCVCDISYVLNMTKSAVSHQLKNLKDENLVKGRKIGKEVWYSLADRHVKEVFDVSLEHILENGEDRDENNG
jgi:ArsR family transcriptional regulator